MANGTVPNWPPPPPTTVMALTFATSAGTVAALAGRYFDVALVAAIATFALATIGLMAVITKARSYAAMPPAGVSSQQKGT